MFELLPDRFRSPVPTAACRSAHLSCRAPLSSCHITAHLPAAEHTVPRHTLWSSSSSQHSSRHIPSSLAPAHCGLLELSRPFSSSSSRISFSIQYGSKSRQQLPAPARAVPNGNDSSQPTGNSNNQQQRRTAPHGMQGSQRQQSMQQQQWGRSQPPGPPPIRKGSQLGRRGRNPAPQQQQQQQQQSVLMTAGQFRQQLKDLMQQQQQLQQVLDATAAAGLQQGWAQAGSRDSRGRRRSKLRAAAASSTDLLLSLLQSQLPVLTGQVPPDQDEPATAPAAAAAVNESSSIQPTPGQQPAPPSLQQQQQQQGRRFRCAPESPPHLPLLAEALNTIAWHCRRQQLLPSEAARLQALLLGQLLPALGPHLAKVNRRQLARVVFALGACADSAWGEEEEDGEEEEEEDQQGSGFGVSRSGQQQQGQGRALVAGGEDGGSSNITQPTAAAAAAEQAGGGSSRSECSSSSSAQSAAAAAAAEASERWVLRLLRRLPPSSLTAGALLAVWQGCGLHGVCPPDSWLAQGSWAMVGHLRSRRLDFNDMAGLLQACAALDYRPPGWLIVPLVAALQQKLGLLTPADLAGVLTSLQALAYRPPDTWLRVWCEVSSRHLAGMSLPQLAAAAGALAWTNYSPAPWWGRRLTAAAAPLLPVATADELLLLLHSLLGLRLGVAPGWLHEAYCHLAQQRGSLGLSQLADAAHVLGGMGGLPQEVVQVHRAWLSVSLQRVGGWQGGAAAAALSRSELLYMLYAAARLRVSPGDTLATAALTRLHRELHLASPAELAGCLSVFCFWWRHQQQQQQQQEDGSAGSSSRDPGSSTGGRMFVSLGQLRDCLAAVVACSSQFSGEGLLQLLMTCAKAGLGATAAPAAGVQPEQQQQQQQQQQQALLLGEVTGSIESLVGELLGRLPGMSLVQLARISRSLEGGPGSSSSGSSSGSSRGGESSSSSRGSSSAGGVAAGGEGGSRSRPEWYERLAREVKAAMASRA